MVKEPEAVNAETAPYNWKIRVKRGELELRNNRFYFSSELEKHFINKKIDQNQYDCGTRYATDYHNGRVELCAKPNYNERVGGKGDITDAAAKKIDAAERWRRAAKILIKRHFDILDHVACNDKTVRSFCKKSLLNERLGMELLRDSLDYLVKFYHYGEK